MDWIKEILFNSGWVTIAAIAVGGVAALWLFRRVRRIGVTLLVAAAVLGGLRWFFPSDAERMEARTHRLMHAVETQDWTTASAMLSDQTTLGTDGQTWAAGKEKIVELARVSCDGVGMHSARITGIETEATATDVTELVSLVTTQQATADAAMPSRLKMEYVKNGDDWMLARITVVSVGDQTGEAVHPGTVP